MIKLIASILICQLAGIVGAVFTTPAISGWYVTLNKPSFNPPNWLFGPVWTFLYLLMGISLFLVWNKKDSKDTKTALIFFAVQLGLNTLWSIIFFGMHLPLVAFLEILFLLFFIALTIIKFFPISKISAYLLTPYFLWVSFATILNLSIAILNS
ncbi:tryptophan-rich sensory protein [Patescibacteria group bacterium]|nr:tryptophan-rich sensory protein [Patescibacteria group bacterium]MCG2702163.1 tryptophan-rich sensory protein [Candidatus Parcubacteria bacterium]MBU4265353.1 tryptophan-rich sensory protein [Patescibacteria group bacterium]MBU4390793.1 tryptophan-rich sensory protein [Patescibacteria group bacterium]MBU4396652.1 tryptophan-rich sensory protein [Patescibacteria group bacterium]